MSATPGARGGEAGADAAAGVREFLDAFLAGQVLGKAWMTLLAVVLLWAWRRRRVAEPLGAE